MTGAERVLQRQILACLTKIRQRDPTLIFRKRHGDEFGVAGDPDLYGIWAGIPFEIELKAPGRYPSALQKVRLEEWGLAGAWTAVIHSMAEFQAMLARLESAARIRQDHTRPTAAPVQNLTFNPSENPNT